MTTPDWTARDEFAARAMAALITGMDYHRCQYKFVANAAYQMAAAMMARGEIAWMDDRPGAVTVATAPENDA